MTARWNYRHELTDFRRHNDGSCSYRTRSEGDIPYEPIQSSLLKMEAWNIARKEAERTGRDIVVYVINNRIISRTRSGCSRN